MLKKITSEPIIFLYATVYMINLSILPQLVLQKVCLQKHYGNSTLCGEKSGLAITQEMKKETSHWWFAILASSQIPAIFTVLIWGPISDAIGRKKAMLLIPIMSILQNIVFLLCSYYINSSIIYLCFGMFLACFFGEFPGVLALSCAFIADVTAGLKAKSRVTRMALIDCAVNLAGLPAGLFAGQLLKHLGFTAVFGLSIGINLLLLAYIIFLLPDPRALQKVPKGKELKESTSSENKKLVPASATNESISDNSSNVSSNIDRVPDSSNDSSSESASESPPQLDKKPITCDLFKPHKQIYLVYNLLSCKERRHLILPPLFAFSFVIYAFIGELTITSLYLKSDPLAFTPDYIGYYYASQAVIRSLGILLVTQFAYRVLKASDVNVLLFGIATQIMCYVLIGFSRDTLSVFMANIIGFGLTVALSLSRSYTSKHVPPEQVGTLMAAFESIDALSFTTNLMSIEVYNATLDRYSGAVFLFLAGCSSVGFCITVANKIYLKRIRNELNSEMNEALNENFRTSDA
ncbi:lysosomal proton-coupled steroid conjugate and bile acid symporter SLC46A3-like [Clytia hemisphaerica]|uniref:Solute carrier family 46 member 3 n=1 Tax=Clytia hemisphaerica TaxID=252671 RepID=A0A7M5WZI8_9CNID